MTPKPPKMEHLTLRLRPELRARIEAAAEAERSNVEFLSRQWQRWVIHGAFPSLWAA